MSDVIAVFARAPIPGQTKTRLARVIGNEAAAELSLAMLSDTLALARRAARDWGNCEVVLAYTPTDAFAAGPYSLGPLWNGPRLAQCTGNLGDRLLDCVARLHQQGKERMVIIGSDSPDLPAGYICRALANLCHADLVFGPARDGGFYLIGTAAPLPNALFDGIEWSDNSTLSRVQTNARRLQLGVQAVPEWDDVDTMHDLQRLAQRLAHDSCSAPTHAPQTTRWLRTHLPLDI